MTSMINLKASRKTGTINVGVNPITNINVNNPSTPTTVSYPDPNVVGFPSVNPQVSTGNEVNISSFETSDPEKQALIREINVLKLIIDIQHSNPMIVNKYIVADDSALCKMVGK